MQFISVIIAKSLLHSVANLHMFLKLDDATELTDHSIDLLKSDLKEHVKKTRCDTAVFADSSSDGEDYDCGEYSDDDFHRPLLSFE